MLSETVSKTSECVAEQQRRRVGCDLQFITTHWTRLTGAAAAVAAPVVTASKRCNGMHEEAIGYCDLCVNQALKKCRVHTTRQINAAARLTICSSYSYRVLVCPWDLFRQSICLVVLQIILRSSERIL